MKYEVYHVDSKKGISYHNTIMEALAAIKNYELIDITDGTYQDNAYDWRVDIGENN